ncbi:WD40 repeat domain-containing protein [Neoaquamicrobium sediminum]|uniref:WD40 repeat domain-containing protein n=1 Tax=Neoaquamicrobium sediminum TaxID=1849104 RepID=UPI001567B1E3|nr:WD40 repeat domain-containing protein [Mesorhizobium sediminum]NRC54140.1 WD40 repeat domain-containing protein [Mesorhizobium sediminum]
MAQGRTRLAAWSADDTLRFYELTETGFSQVGAVGMAHDATAVSEGRPPILGFIKDGRFLSALWQVAPTSSVRLSAFNMVPAEVSNSAYSLSGISFRVVSDWNEPFGYRPLLRGDNTSGYGFAIDDAAAVTNTGTESGFSVASRRSLAFSPDGQLAVLGADSGQSSIHIVDSPTIGNPAFVPLTTLSEHLAPVDAVYWSDDGNFFFAVDRSAGGKVTVFRRGTANAFDAVWEISSAHGDPHAVAVSRDRRHVAVSFVGSGVYTTVVYRRLANVFQPIQTLAQPMGRLLGFSGDGALLIDANAKVAYRNVEGVFEEQVGLFTNVAGTVMAQAVSPHMDQIVSTSSFYDGALAALVTDTVDLQALKVVLLSDAAEFDPNASTLAEVTNGGAYEVHGNGWTEGGEPLTSVANSEVNGNLVALVADDISRIIFGGGIEFRYAVIVEGSTPRIFTDFSQPVIVGADKELGFDFSNGLVVYSL